MKKLLSYVKKLGWLEWGILIILISLATRPLVDPDFGWHLKAGMDYIKHLSIPHFDPYSHTLPNWYWVNHEWLADSISAALYQVGGSLSLSFFFAAIITAAFLIAASVTRVGFKYKVLAATLALLASLPILGVRMQMITLLGMAILLYILYQYQNGRIKSLWWLPIIFLFWVNLHGGFVIGLVILAAVFGIELIKFIVAEKLPKFYKRLNVAEPLLNGSQLRHIFAIGGLSGLATLLNPYGWKLYYDFYLLFKDDYAIVNIGEWQPVVFNNPLSFNFAIYLVLFCLLLLLAYRKFEPMRLGLLAIFLYLSFLYWRNMPFFMVMSVGFLAEIISTNTNLIFDEIKRNKIFIAAFAMAFIFILYQRVTDLSRTFTDETQLYQATGYPAQAVQWMKAHPDQLGTKMFNDYGWGGFIVWKYPEQKVFVDGRMAFWKEEGKFPFEDHDNLYAAKPGTIEKMEQLYGIDWAVIRKGSSLYWALKDFPGWQQVYEDDLSAIYSKIKTT